MTKARDLADLIAAGSPLADGTIEVADITDLTATATELNILDGVTATTTELNYVAGVTSAIQNQLDAKGTVSTLSDLGITSTAEELNYVSGVTSAIQTQLNAKAATADIGTTIQPYDADTAKLDVVQTFSANQTVSAEFVATSYNETYAAVTSTSNATTVNCEAGNTFSHTLTENTTFTFSNPPASGTAYTMTIEIIQDAGATGYTVTWPASVDFPAGTAPTLTATASAVDVFVFTTRDGGTTWYGFTAGLGLATPA